MLDESGAPLQIGLTVERFPNTDDTPDEGAKKLLASAKANRRLEQVGEATFEPMKLADGTDAVLLTTEFVKDGLRSFPPTRNPLATQPTSSAPLATSLICKPFCLDASKLDEAKLGLAYGDGGKAADRAGLDEADRKQLDALLAAAQRDRLTFDTLLDGLTHSGEYN
jgi:hypothetical protein